MGRTLETAKLFVCVVTAIAVPWLVCGEDDQGDPDVSAETSVKHAADTDAREYEHTGEEDGHGEDPAELEHLSELLDSRMPESEGKLRLSVSADHPITKETHGYEERTFIDVSFPPGGSLKANNSTSKAHETHDENTVSLDHEDGEHSRPEEVVEVAGASSHVHEVYHDADTSNGDHSDVSLDFEKFNNPNANNPSSLDEQEQQQLPFPDAAEAGYSELSNQLHECTFGLIKAEIRGDAELVQSSINEMTRSLQSIIDRASHPESPEPSELIDSAARSMAIHLDRIDFALSQEDTRKVSLLVGKVATKVKELEALMETEESQNHGGEAPNGVHH